MFYAPKSSIIRNYCYMVTFDIIVFFKNFLKEKERPLWTPLLNNGRKLCYETLWLNHNRAS